MRPQSQDLFRLFFALKPSVANARRTDHLAESLFGAGPRVRMEHQHVTLAVTVDYDVYPYEGIKALLRAATAVRAEPFDLALDRLSLSNRSAALRPSRAVPPLNDLQRRIAAAMQRAGVTARPGWRFSPHQTLLYRDGQPGQRAIEGFLWRVEQFVLVCSHVGRTRHETLGCWPLTGDGQLRLL